MKVFIILPYDVPICNYYCMNALIMIACMIPGRYRSPRDDGLDLKEAKHILYVHWLISVRGNGFGHVEKEPWFIMDIILIFFMMIISFHISSKVCEFWWAHDYKFYFTYALVTCWAKAHPIIIQLMVRSKLNKVMQSGEHNESEVRKFKLLSF